MIWKIVVEVVGHFVAGLLIFYLWEIMPMATMRFALVIAYLVLLRWGWRRGNE